MTTHHHQQDHNHNLRIDVSGDSAGAAATSNDSGLVSLHIVQNNEGALEVEGVLAAEELDTDTAVVKHAADDGSIDEDVLDFISELESGSKTGSPVDVSLLSPVQPTEEAELDAVKQNLDDIFSGFTEKERTDFDCDYSAVTECSSAVTEKMSNQSTEELRHSDASYTPTSGLTLRKYARPEISHDEVLIRVHATTISTRDCLERIRRDNNEGLVHEAWVPGHDIVGVVEQTGLNSKHLLHRRVAALLPHGGGCSRYVRVHSHELIDLPEKDFPASTVSSQDIVHLLSTYMTAYQCLERALHHNEQTFCGATDLIYSDSDDFAARSPLSGSCVLINGAGSPVGLALIDIAKNAGAKAVYALSHSSYEHSIRELGVKEWYPLFRQKEWKSKWSGKMDVIVDTVGDHHSYTSFYKVMASGCRFVRMNTTSCGEKFVPMDECTEDHLSVWKGLKGSSVHRMAVDYDIFDSFRDEKEVFAKDLHYLFSLFRYGKILPTVFSRVGLDKLDEEWEKVMGGGANGATGVVIVSPNNQIM